MEPYEQAYRDEVCAFIRAEEAHLREKGAALRSEMREAGRRMAEEDPYASIYGLPDGEIPEAQRNIEEMERQIDSAGSGETEADFLEKLRLNPYFGRVDFAKNGDAPAPYYIGLRTLRRPDDGYIYTYDWRAPVGSLFYTGEVGAASYAAPGGEVRGEITRIRQYRFREGRLTACWDSSPSNRCSASSSS